MLWISSVNFYCIQWKMRAKKTGMSSYSFFTLLCILYTVNNMWVFLVTKRCLKNLQSPPPFFRQSSHQIRHDVKRNFCLLLRAPSDVKSSAKMQCQNINLKSNFISRRCDAMTICFILHVFIMYSGHNVGFLVNCQKKPNTLYYCSKQTRISHDSKINL